jgi:outer membrane protein assembly factor BamB
LDGVCDLGDQVGVDASKYFEVHDDGLPLVLATSPFDATPTPDNQGVAGASVTPCPNCVGLRWRTTVAQFSPRDVELSSDGRILVLRSGIPSLFSTVALRTDDGVELWRSTIGGDVLPASFTPSIAISGDTLFTARGGEVYATCGEPPPGRPCNGPPRLFANDLLTGDPIFDIVIAETPGDLIAHPNAPVVFVAGGGLGVSAYGTADGTMLWTDPEHPYLGIASSLVATPRGDALFGAAVRLRYPYDCTVRAYDSSNGAVLWSRDIPPEQCDYRAYPTLTVSPLGTRLFVRSTGDDDFGNRFLTVQSLDATTGETQWLANPLPANSLSGTCDLLFLQGRYGVIAFKAATGEELWRNETLEVNGGVATLGTLVVTGERVDDAGNETFVLEGLSPNTGVTAWSTRIRERPGGVIADPSGRRLYVLTYGPKLPITEATVNAYVPALTLLGLMDELVETNTSLGRNSESTPLR